MSSLPNFESFVLKDKRLITTSNIQFTILPIEPKSSEATKGPLDEKKSCLRKKKKRRLEFTCGKESQRVCPIYIVTRVTYVTRTIISQTPQVNPNSHIWTPKSECQLGYQARIVDWRTTPQSLTISNNSPILNHTSWPSLFTPRNMGQNECGKHFSSNCFHKTPEWGFEKLITISAPAANPKDSYKPFPSTAASI